LGHFVRRGRYYAWRPQGTDDWLLIASVSGRGRIGTANGERWLEPRQLVLFSPGTPQNYGIAPDVAQWELLWAHFVPPPEWEELLRWPAWAPGVMLLEIGEAVRWRRVTAALRRACELSERRLARRQEFGWNGLHEALLWCDADNPLSEEGRLDPRVRRAIDYIASDPRRPLTVAEVARAARLSASRTISLFQKQLGATPRQYWEQQRIERARRLLEHTTLNVAEVGEAVGFVDPFYFSSRFKALTGASPRDYRRKHPGESSPFKPPAH
jgi:AraC family transcriptional regulator of arabinose operon